MFQRKYLIFLAVLSAFALAWSGGWFWLADKLRSDIASFVNAQRDNGIVLDWSDMRISGFPIRFDTTFENPQATRTTADTRISWAGAATAIRPFIEGPGIVSFDAPGRHQFDIRNRDTDISIDTNADSLQGRLAFDTFGQPRGLRGRAAPLTARLEDGPEITTAETAFDWEMHTDPSAGESLSVVLKQIDLTAIPVDETVATTFGQTIQTVSGRATLRGPLDPAALDAASLTRWRDSGGTLELESFNLIWGPLRIAGDGTLSVDPTLQPVGAFSARIAGLDRLLDLLEERGQIPRQQAALARIGLAVLLRTPANGGPAEARLPVTLQDRVLSIGPIPLLTLEPIIWN